MRYEAQPTPSFCIVQSGECWLTLEGEESRRLAAGDFVLLPLTPAFTLVSELGVPCRPGRPSRTGVRHGEPKGAPDFRMVGGTFEVEPVNAGLLELVAQPIHVRANEGDTTRLRRIIELILDEYGAERPGRETILRHFLEAMLVEALRWPSWSGEAVPAGLVPAGLLAGMRDGGVARALQALHTDVARGWTVAELAKRAGMSRSAFATRFGETVGCAPMEYLGRWRMSLAQDALARGGRSLEAVAEEIGYQSGSAFSTAFRKRFGCAPGAFARSAQRRGPRL